MRQMNKRITSLIVCLFILISASAQTLTMPEIEAAIYRAFGLFKELKYNEALEAFLHIGANVDASRSEPERQAHVYSLGMACSCYTMTEQYEKAFQLAEKLIAGNLSDSEKGDIYHQYVYNGYILSGKLMLSKRPGGADYAKARELLERVRPYAEGDFRNSVRSRFCTAYYFEGMVNLGAQKFNVALNCFEQALKGYSELGMAEHELSTLKNMASAQYHMYNIQGAIKSYEKALSLSRCIDDKTEFIALLAELYRLYGETGNIEKVTDCMNCIDSVMAVAVSNDVRFEYNVQRGKEAEKQGRFNIAEQWFFKCKDIAEKQAPAEISANKYIAYAAIRDLYAGQNRYDEALQYAKMVIKEGKQNVASADMDFYLSYISPAKIYSCIGDRENCQKYLDSLFIAETSVSEPRRLSLLYSTRATCYSNLHEYELALGDYKKANEILAAKYPSSDGDRAGLYAMIGGMEHVLNHYEESEYYYDLYADAIKDIYGESSLKYIKAQVYLANAQGFAGHIKDGCDSYTSAITKLKGVVRRNLPYMNTTEREGFWNSLMPLFTLMTPYALKAGLYQTEYTKTCYDALLLSKAFLLDSERSILDVIQAEGDDKDMQTYLKISMLNARIKEWEKNYSLYADSILMTSDSVNSLEKDLMRRCKSMGCIAGFMSVNYDAVRGYMRRGDVLIDFTDFTLENGDRRYAAYVVKKNLKYPLLVPLFTESQIDSLGITRPDMFYDSDYAPSVIKLLWNPLKEYIAEGATVYYVPSQMLFRVSPESLPLEDGTLLGEHYNFARLSSARELVKRQNGRKPDWSSAVLYGGLQYDLKPELMAENAKQYELPDLLVMRGMDTVRGDSIFNELPGSKVEVEAIADILRRSHIKVTPYSGMEGTEESFLNMHAKSPSILHMATHGFYYTPSAADDVNFLKGYSDAMSLSGLIMSGGNAAWRGEILPDGVLDGILTASNIARLDLSATDMVVLSACQTGQGSATAEGLYGLQRAFKKAGAGTMVMTLWSVSDKVATEFMIKFYEVMVENGWDKHKAFEQAKSYIRTQHPDPYHWAAFVMLD